MMSALDKTVDFMAKLIKFIIIICAILLVLVVFTEVVLRYVFSTSMLWNDEGSRFLFVWIVYFAIAYALHDKSHIKLDIISEKIPRLATPLKVLAWCTTTVFFSVFLWCSYIYMVHNSSKIAPATHIPYVIIYAVLPVTSIAGLLFLAHQALHFFVDRRAINRTTEGE